MSDEEQHSKRAKGTVWHTCFLPIPAPVIKKCGGIKQSSGLFIATLCWECIYKVLKGLMDIN